MTCVVVEKLESSEGKQNLPPKYASGIKIILNWLFLRKSRFGRSSENPSRSDLFVRDIYIYKGNLHLRRGLSLSTRKRRMGKFLKTYKWGRQRLKFIEKPYPHTFLFLATSHNCPQLPNIFL